MGLSCDLPRRTNTQLGIRLVERVFAVEEIQNVELKRKHAIRP